MCPRDGRGAVPRGGQRGPAPRGRGGDPSGHGARKGRRACAPRLLDLGVHVARLAASVAGIAVAERLHRQGGHGRRSGAPLPGGVRVHARSRARGAPPPAAGQRGRARLLGHDPPDERPRAAADAPRPPRADPGGGRLRGGSRRAGGFWRALAGGPRAAVALRVHAFRGAGRRGQIWQAVESAVGLALGAGLVASGREPLVIYAVAAALAQATMSVWASHVPHNAPAWDPGPGGALHLDRVAHPPEPRHHGLHHARPEVPCRRLREAARGRGVLEGRAIDLPEHHPGPAKVLGRARLSDRSALQLGGRRRHLQPGDLPPRARPRAVERGLRRALAAPLRRPLRGEPQPDAAVPPVPGHPQAEPPGHQDLYLESLRAPGHRSAPARRPLRRGRLGVAHPRRLGPGLAGVARRAGDLPVHLLPAGRRHRLPARLGRAHLRHRAHRPVPPGRQQHLRVRLLRHHRPPRALRRPLPARGVGVVDLQLRGGGRGRALRPPSTTARPRPSAFSLAVRISRARSIPRRRWSSRPTTSW